LCGFCDFFFFFSFFLSPSLKAFPDVLQLLLENVPWQEPRLRAPSSNPLMWWLWFFLAVRGRCVILAALGLVLSQMA